MSKFKIASLFAVVLTAAVPSYGAHWIVQSQTLVSQTPSDGTVTPGTPAQVSVTLPSGLYAIYGSGTFKFFGEADTFATTASTSVPGSMSYNAWEDSYYTFVYKWVADTPGDTPPGAGSNPDLDGYSLESVTPSGSSQGIYQLPQPNYPTPAAVITNYSWHLTFNTQGPIWAGPSTTPTPPYPIFPGLYFNWPSSGAAQTVTIGSEPFYIRPVVVASGIVSIDGSGNTICTATVLNNENILIDSSFDSTFPGTLHTANGGHGICYLGATEIGGLYVTS